MAQITVQKQISEVTTKSVLTITESKRTSTKTTFAVNMKTNLVSSIGWVGTSISLTGVVKISGTGMTTQEKGFLLKNSAEVWDNTNVHTVNSTFEVTIPANVSNVTVTYSCYYSDSPNDKMSGSTSMALSKLISILNSFANNSSLNIEQPLTLSISQYDANYTNDLILYFRDAENNMTEITTWQDVTDGQEIQLTQEQVDWIYSLTPDNKFYSLTWRLKTLNNGTQMGSMDLPSVGLITDADPIFTDFNYEDVNVITTNLTGNNQTVIGAFSTVKVTIPTKAIAQKGARIVSYLIGDISVQESDGEISLELPNYNSDTIVVSAIDSRTKSTTVTKKIQDFKVYEPIEVEETNATIERNNGSEEGTIINFSGTFWNGNFGVVDNSLKISYKYREAGSTSEYTPGVTNIVPDISEKNFSVTDKYILGDTNEGFNTGDSFEIVVIIEDELSIHEIEYRLDPGVDAIVIEGNKVISMNGLVNLLYPVGSIYMSVNDVNPETFFGGKWEQITDDAYLKIVSSNAGALGGTSKDHKIPLTSIPSHSHTFGTWYNGATGTATTVEGWSTKKQEKTHSTSNAGGGQAYYPYYLGVYVWIRVE